MRKATKNRSTAETKISVTLNLDGRGKYTINTGVPFFDHMLSLFAKHAGFDLTVLAKGDTQVDYHHTVEDIGIVLGEVFREALGDKKGIRRYGFWVVPMDESQATVVVDCSDRPYLLYQSKLLRGKIGDFPAELIQEFFQAFVNNARINLHIIQEIGSNKHHQSEAIFKAFARSLSMAVQKDKKNKSVPSTKGVL
jgi:imidazoleglycerol-phosphate dehydratase